MMVVEVPDLRLTLLVKWDFWSPDGGVGLNPTPDSPITSSEKKRYPSKNFLLFAK